MVSRRGWFFNKPGTDAQSLTPTDKLEETFKMLEDEEGVLIEKSSQENEKAEKFTIAKNSRVGKGLAEKHQKIKKMYDGTIELYGNYQLKIIQKIIKLKRAIATVKTVNALRAGDAAMKEMLKANNIADVCNFVEGINEQHTITGQIEAVVQPPFLDKDELDATVETVNAPRAGDAAMKEILKANNIADVCNFVEGINEQHTLTGQIEAVVQPPFPDKDELDAKVE